MPRLHVPSEHKDWLYQILKPINEVPTRPLITIPFLNLYNGLIDNIEVKSLSGYIHDPRGFYVEVGTSNCIDIVTETGPVRYVDFNIGSISTQCQECGLRYLHSMMNTSTSICKECECKVRFILAKNNNVDWNALSLGSPPYFGFEIEFECPKHIEGIHKFVNRLHAKFIAETGMKLPAYICKDGSLRNGLEFNFFPMGMDYILENNAKLSRFFEMMREEGCSHIAYNGEETAGIHCHISMDGDKDIYSCQPHIDHYVDSWAEEFFIPFSGRSALKFNQWCNTIKCKDYQYIGKRNGSNTVECRGFSFSKLMSDPKALLTIARFCKGMINLYKMPSLVESSPFDVFGTIDHGITRVNRNSKFNPNYDSYIRKEYEYQIAKLKYSNQIMKWRHDVVNKYAFYAVPYNGGTHERHTINGRDYLITYGSNRQRYFDGQSATGASDIDHETLAGVINADMTVTWTKCPYPVSEAPFQPQSTTRCLMAIDSSNRDFDFVPQAASYHGLTPDMMVTARVAEAPVPPNFHISSNVSLNESAYH